MNMKKTSEFIKNRRKELGYTQETLAQCLDVTSKAVSKWERGLSFPDVTLFNNLAVTLKCSICDLINGTFPNSESSNVCVNDAINQIEVTDCSENMAISFDADSEAYVSPFLFGNNLEHTRNSIYMGLSAQMLRNRKFAGKPKPDGCAYEWHKFGEAMHLSFVQSYTRHADNYHMKRVLECNALQISSFKSGTECGICQDGLYIGKDREYSFGLVIKSVFDCEIKISLSDCEGNELCRKYISLEETDDFIKKEIILSSVNNCENARISISFNTVNTITIGALSLMPSDNFYGMRIDVVENMKKLGISILRWPGGNFAGEYNWQDGLLPVDMRAPLQSYQWIETQPDSLGFDFHEINTDDFVMLCREIGAEPFITINPTWNTPAQSAAWVEYCNGDKSTEYGKIRISRGFKEPHNVKFWSLGNEFGYGHMEGTNTSYEYSKTVGRHAKAMLAVTPNLSLCSSGPYPDIDWVNHSAKPLSNVAQYVSIHCYIDYPAFDSPDKYKEQYEYFIKETVDVKRRFCQMRKDLKDNKIRISFDEWNAWFEWYRTESVASGIFAAVVLHIIIAEAEKYGVDIACHFEAVNEGAIVVEKNSCHLTPMGQAIAVMTNHKFGKILFASDFVVATEKDGVITTTIVNTSYDEHRQFNIPKYTDNAEGTVYKSCNVLPGSTFVTEKIDFEKENNCYNINQPPHSIGVFVQK